MNRVVLAALAGIGLLVVLAGLAVAGLRTVNGMIETAAATARAERDNYWRAEIEKSNAATQAKIAENLKQTMAAQDAARDQVAAAEARAAELEKENAALPDDGAGGLSRDRVRLLNKR